MYKLFLATVCLLTLCVSNQSFSKEHFKIGVIATLEGAYTVLGEDALRGLKTALKTNEDLVAEDTVELIIESTNRTPEGAVKAAQILLDKGVDIIIGPMSSDQGIALRDFSRKNIQTTFINGISGAIDTTYTNPSENFFRFNTDNAQWSAGLGNYAYNTKEHKKVAIIAKDYSFNRAQVTGFLNEYCNVGGVITGQYWLEPDEKDYSKTISEIDENIDALYLGLSGSDAIQFLSQYTEAGGNSDLIGSSITVDDALLNATDDIKKLLIGMPSAGPQADTWANEDWQAFVKAYQGFFSADGRFSTPSILATGYHNAGLAALTCFNRVESDLSDNQTRFRQCLSTLELKAPNGNIKLDENRQAIANNFVTEVVKLDIGKLSKKIVRIREDVDQTLGLGRKQYDVLRSSSKNSTACPSK